MNGAISQEQQSINLIKFGVALFLLGLITGFVIPSMENPRMGLSSHLEAVMNGMFLILIGIIWSRLSLPKSIQNFGYVSSLYGTYTNWGTTLFAGIIGGGSELMPLAGKGLQGTFWQEALIKFGLISLSLSMVAVCVIILYGLSRKSRAE